MPCTASVSPLHCSMQSHSHSLVMQSQVLQGQANHHHHRLQRPRGDISRTGTRTMKRRSMHLCMRLQFQKIVRSRSVQQHQLLQFHHVGRHQLQNLCCNSVKSQGNQNDIIYACILYICIKFVRSLNQLSNYQIIIINSSINALVGCICFAVLIFESCGPVTSGRFSISCGIH